MKDSQAVTKQDLVELFDAQSKTFDDKLDSKLNAQSKTFDVKLDSLSNTLDQKLDTQSKAFDKKLDAQSKTFDEKLDKLETTLIDKITNAVVDSNQTITQGIERMDTEINKRLDELVDNTPSKQEFEVLRNRVKRIEDRLKQRFAQ